METGTAETARTRFTGSVALAGAIAGLVAGACGLIVEMLRAVLGLGLGASYDAERRLEPAWFELPQGSPFARA